MAYRDLSPEQANVANELGYMGMFAERDTLQEAYNYADKLIQSLKETDRVGMYTALHVLVNTYAVQIASICNADQLKQAAADNLFKKASKNGKLSKGGDQTT